MFSASVNTTTGKTEWSIVEDKDSDSSISDELSRSQYSDMLLDTERNKAYFKGIQHAVDTIRRRNKEPIVLDIGTGTGLLAMMAAKCGAKKITACEVLKPMAKMASQITTHNGFNDVIKVVPLRSTDLVVGKRGHIEEKANILITEVFDTELIGEGVLPTLLHAHQHLLEPDAVVVPSLATVYVQLFHSPRLWTSQKLDPANFPPGVVTVPESWQGCAGSPSLWDIHVEELESDQITFLSEPQIAAEFTFTRPPMTTPQQCEVHVTRSGLCHGLIMWWELLLCPNVSLSTSPWNRTQWRDHWLQDVQLLPNALYIQEGNKLFVETYNDDYCLWFTVNEIKKHFKGDTVERPLCTCGAHIVWNRSRMSILNDSCRNQLFYDLLSKHTSGCENALCVSDASLLPLLLTKLGVKRTFVLESVSSFSTRVMNEIIRLNNVEKCIKTISGSSEDLSLLDIQGTKIDMIVGEPYFSSSLLPWHSLYFWYVRTYANHLLNDQIKVIPFKAHLQSIAVKFDNLHKLRSEISAIEGFNLSAYQAFIQQDVSCDPEPHFLWEYPCVSCSHVHNIFEFDFTQPLDLHTVVESFGSIPLLKPGANAVVLWMVFYLDEYRSISEGLIKDPVLGNKLSWDHKFKQAVKFLCKAADENNQTVNYDGKFYTETGDLSINISFNPVP